MKPVMWAIEWVSQETGESVLTHQVGTNLRVMEKAVEARRENGEHVNLVPLSRTPTDPRAAYMDVRTCICGEDASEHLCPTARDYGFNPDWDEMRRRYFTSTETREGV